MRVVVAPVDEFKPGDRRIITVGGRSIGVFRVGDRFYGIRNRCPHQGGPLCQGRIAPWARSSGPGDFQLDAEATLLACPWHGWEYDLATGQSFLGPGEPGVKSYDVDVAPGAGSPAASPVPTSPRRSRSTSRRTTLSSMPSAAPESAAAATDPTERAVKLVDADIHPAPLPSYIAERLDEPFRARYERYGVRVANPPQMYPRVRNQGYRVDSWPEGGFPGSDYELMRDQLLEEHKVDYGILIPLHGHSFGAEAPSSPPRCATPSTSGCARRCSTATSA